ncbi:hypothetical protein BH24CHL7_BH24CHL7_14770 [soil metagenome]
MSNLGSLPGSTFSRAFEINARGIAVGEAFTASPERSRAVLWHDGHAHDLNDFLAPGSGWVLRSAEGINEEGQIVGYGTFEGQTRAFLLTPGA